MILSNHLYRNRAALALHSLIGGAATGRILSGLPAVIEMPDAQVMIVAGDHERALSPSALKPLATSTGWTVLATWVDPMLSGHRFQIDAVLIIKGEPLVFAERCLLRTKEDATFLVSASGDDPALMIGEGGVHLVPCLPWRDGAERLLGIAAGQALLQQRIYADSPYASPLARNIGR